MGDTISGGVRCQKKEEANRRCEFRRLRANQSKEMVSFVDVYGYVWRTMLRRLFFQLLSWPFHPEMNLLEVDLSGGVRTRNM